MSEDSYAKVFRCMYTGSMYGAGVHVFAVWGWVLAHKDENGHAEINPDLVAHQLGTVAQQVEEALDYLSRPDPKSRSKEHEGRRLIRASQFGYQVVNNDRYRDRGGSRRDYWWKWREKKNGATVAQRGAQRRATQTETEAKTEKNKPPYPLEGGSPCGADSTKQTNPQRSTDSPEPSTRSKEQPTPHAGDEHFERFWTEYPRKVARKRCSAIWRSLKLTLEQAEQAIEAVRRYRQTDQWQKDDGQFIPHPSTFLNQRRWEDQIPTKPEPKRGDPDWDPTDEEGLAMFRECGVEMKPGPMSQEDCERLSRELGVKVRPAEA